MLLLCDLPQFEWTPDQVEQIADHLDEERVEELRGGADLNEEETELWDSYLEGIWDIQTILEIYAVIHSQRPELRAYVGWHSASCGQSGDDLAWAGPLPEGKELQRFAIEQTSEWRNIGFHFDPTDILEVDGISESDALDDHWDEVDRTQADLIFQAVKAARIEVTRSDAPHREEA